jgi:hypothetical protein
MGKLIFWSQSCSEPHIVIARHKPEVGDNNTPLAMDFSRNFDTFRNVERYFARPDPTVSLKSSINQWCDKN